MLMPMQTIETAFTRMMKIQLPIIAAPMFLVSNEDIVCEASAAGAHATLAGSATRSANDAPWRVAGQTALVEFDPAPWWPGADDTPWRRDTCDPRSARPYGSSTVSMT